jgi:hypothetical protein
MRQVLIFEYGRAADFAIQVDGKLLGVDDVLGTYTDERLEVTGVDPVQLRFAIADERSAQRQAGIVLRVDGKVVGKHPTQVGPVHLVEDQEVRQPLRARFPLDFLDESRQVGSQYLVLAHDEVCIRQRAL